MAGRDLHANRTPDMKYLTPECVFSNTYIVDSLADVKGLLFGYDFEVSSAVPKLVRKCALTQQCMLCENPIDSRYVVVAYMIDRIIGT